MSLLTVNGLEASYGDFRALHGASFAVEAGEIVSLIGANGAGKTTTLKSLMGIVRPTAGEIAFDGMRMTVAPRARSWSADSRWCPKAATSSAR